MKKSINVVNTLLFVLVAILILSVLTACGNNDQPKTDDPTNTPTDNPAVTVEMTNSYKTNRANFKTVTGIELPALEKLEAEDYPYRAGDTSYCFDITGGDNLNYATYQNIENFFKQQFGNCDEGYPTGDEATGRDAQWTKEGRWYQTYWDETNKAIYINTTVKESSDKQMTDSYRLAREQFSEVTYYNLPIVFDVEADMTLVNAYMPGRSTYEISLESGSNLNYQTYMVFENFFSDNFTADAGFPTGTETAGREARFTTHNNVTLYTKYTTQGYIVIGVEPVQQQSANMTESYSQTRTSFQTVSGLLLPELATVTGMFEDLGSDMFMLDIGSATEDTLTAVMAAFNTQTNTTYSLDLYGKNVYVYTREVNNVTKDCELSCFYDDGLVVIMYQETLPAHMSESYSLARSIFNAATGVDIPAIADLEADIAFGDGYVMLDIVDGTNLTKATYDSIIEFLDGLTGWTGEQAPESTEYYPTRKYTNSSASIVIQAVWNGESEKGGIYLNVYNSTLLPTFNGFNKVKDYLAARYDITLPAMSNSTVDFSCAADSTWMTFDMSRESNFTETEYSQFVSALTAKLGNGTNADDENQKRTTWTVNGLLWDVTWDLTTGIAVNFSEAN